MGPKFSNKIAKSQKPGLRLDIMKAIQHRLGKLDMAKLGNDKHSLFAIAIKAVERATPKISQEIGHQYGIKKEVIQLFIIHDNEVQDSIYEMCVNRIKINNK